MKKILITALCLIFSSISHATVHSVSMINHSGYTINHFVLSTPSDNRDYLYSGLIPYAAFSVPADDLPKFDSRYVTAYFELNNKFYYCGSEIYENGAAVVYSIDPSLNCHTFINFP